MIGYICQNLRCSIRTSPIHKLYFLHNPPILSCLRYISCDNIANRDSFTVSYLVNSCGLSPESAVSASKHVCLKNPHRFDSVLSSFTDHGFTLTQISNIVEKYPQVLLCKPEKTISPKLEFFFSKGLTCSEVYQLLFYCPAILRRSLKDHIIPSFKFLEELLQSNEKAVTTIKRSKRMLLYSPGTLITPKISFLLDNGVPESRIIKFLHYYPATLMMDLDRFKKHVEKAKEMGFNPSKSLFFKAVAVLMGLSKVTWERKVDVYKRWGLSEGEIIGAFKKLPAFMAISEKKISTTMDYFVSKLGWKCSLMAKYPVLISLSLEKRIIPRASILQFLVSKGLIEKSFRSQNLFVITEEDFVQKFIKHHAESAHLLKLYREKLDLSR